MNSLTDIQTQKLRELAKKYNLLVFVLFGSRAKNSFNEKSDYDLAFYTVKPMPHKQEFILFEEVLSVIENEKIDLININTNHNAYLRNEIFQNGVCIYESKKGLFFDLKWNAYIDYEDFKKYYDMKNELLIKKLERRVSENG